MARRGSTARDLSVGIVVAVAASIFAFGIFSIGSEQRLWTRKATFRLLLPSSEGLQEGAPVRLAGVQVGTVTRILLPTDPERVEIEVEFAIDRSVAARVRADSTASLRILSLLAGDRFVELTPGSAEEPELPPGSVVPVPAEVGLEQLQAIGATIADDLRAITGSFRVILEQLQNQDTVLGQALFDPEFGREALRSLGQSMVASRDLLRSLETGEGLAGRMIMDRQFADETIARVEGSLARLESILGKLEDEEGALVRALDPNGPLNRILGNLQSSSESLLAVAERLRDGRGLAGKLLADDEYAEGFLEDLRATAHGLREIVDKLNSSEGTAGALLNDPGIYRDLHDVLRGVKKSKMLSWLIRRYRKKGEKDRIKEEEKMLEQTAAGEGL